MCLNATSLFDADHLFVQVSGKRKQNMEKNMLDSYALFFKLAYNSKNSIQSDQIIYGLDIKI